MTRRLAREEGVLGGVSAGANVFAASLIAKRLCEAREQRKTEDVPDVHHSRDNEQRENGGTCHLYVLRDEKDLAAFDAVGEDPADEREEEDGDAVEELVKREQKAGMA